MVLPVGLKRWRVVDDKNQGIDLLTIQVDPAENVYALAQLQLDVTGTPIGTPTNPLATVGEEDYTQTFEYDAAGNLIYQGRAPPGTAKAAASWQIKRFTYDASNNLTDVQYAGGSPATTWAWDARATLAYS